MLFTIKGSVINKTKPTNMGVQLGKDKLVEDTRVWTKHHDLTKVEITHHIYIYKNRVTGSMNDEVGLVADHVQDSTDAAVIFQVMNFSITEIIAKPLTIDEVPDYVKNPEKIVKDMTQTVPKPENKR